MSERKTAFKRSRLLSLVDSFVIAAGSRRTDEPTDAAAAADAGVGDSRGGTETAAAADDDDDDSSSSESALRLPEFPSFYNAKPETVFEAASGGRALPAHRHMRVDSVYRRCSKNTVVTFQSFIAANMTFNRHMKRVSSAIERSVPTAVASSSSSSHLAVQADDAEEQAGDDDVCAMSVDDVLTAHSVRMSSFALAVKRADTTGRASQRAPPHVVVYYAMDDSKHYVLAVSYEVRASRAKALYEHARQLHHALYAHYERMTGDTSAAIEARRFSTETAAGVFFHMEDAEDDAASVEIMRKSALFKQTKCYAPCSLPYKARAYYARCQCFDNEPERASNVGGAK